MSFTALTLLFPGDIVQLDGGVAVVEAVGTSTAECIDIATGKPRACPAELPKSLITKRGGQPALEKFIEEKLKQKDKGENMKLELGDEIVMDGRRHVCTAVTGKEATLTDYSGKSQQVNRHINSFFVPHGEKRRDEKERLKFLEQFRATVKELAPVEPVKPKAKSLVRAKNESQRGESGESKPSHPAPADHEHSGEHEKTTRRTRIFGSSAVRVAMTLGKLGADPAKVLEVFERHGVKVCESTVKLNMGHGRRGMKGADLTKEQLAEFGL
jgi:hypothetical protein